MAEDLHLYGRLLSSAYGNNHNPSYGSSWLGYDRPPSASFDTSSNHSFCGYAGYGRVDSSGPSLSAYGNNYNHAQTLQNADSGSSYISSFAETSHNHFGSFGSSRNHFVEPLHASFVAQDRPYFPYNSGFMHHGSVQGENYVGERTPGTMDYGARILNSGSMLPFTPLTAQNRPPMAPPTPQIYSPVTHLTSQFHPPISYSMAGIHSSTTHLTSQIHIPKAHPTPQVVQQASIGPMPMHGAADVNSRSTSSLSHFSSGFHAFHQSMNHENHLKRTDFNGAKFKKRKKKPTNLEALIKETRDLHSLFRTGLTQEQDADDGSKGSLCKDYSNDDVWNGEVYVKHRTNDWHDYFAHNGNVIEKENKRSRKDDSFQKDCEWIETCKSQIEMKNELEEMSLGAPATSSGDSVLASEEKPLKAKDKDTAKTSEVKKCLQTIAREKLSELMSNSCDDDDDDDDEIEDGFYSDFENEEACLSSSQSVKGKEERSYDFFLKLFEENQELTKLYEEQCHVGKFECLVCSTIKGKAVKMFTGLTSVVLHASKIQKTKRRQEHRGFGRAICTILGWNRERLPSSSESKTLCPRGCLPQDE